MSKVGKKVIVKKPLSQDGLFVNAGAKGTIVQTDNSDMPLKVLFFEESLNDTVVDEDGDDALSCYIMNEGWWLDEHHIRIGSLCYLNNRPVNL